jgi:hypothetical protein
VRNLAVTHVVAHHGLDLLVQHQHQSGQCICPYFLPSQSCGSNHSLQHRSIHKQVSRTAPVGVCKQIELVKTKLCGSADCSPFAVENLGRSRGWCPIWINWYHKKLVHILKTPLEPSYIRTNIQKPIEHGWGKMLLKILVSNTIETFPI